MKTAFCFIIISLLFTVAANPQTPRPEFSEKSGFYKDSVIVSIYVSSPVDAIYYTIDGSDPDETSIRYSAPLVINQSTVIKVAAVSGEFYSKTITATYFINEQSLLPVFSISTDSKYFFHPDTGFYVVGPNPRSPNYGKDWELPIHMEFFETDGRR